MTAVLKTFKPVSYINVLVHMFYSSWKIIRVKTKTPSVLWRLWTRNFHKGSGGVLQQVSQKGTCYDQVTKKHKKERSACQAVLDCFDQQYSRELGELWPSTRAALLDPQSWQYGVMLNRFSAVTDITQILQSRGFSALLHDAPLLCNGPSEVSDSKHHKGALLAPHHVPDFPPDDSHPEPDSSSPALRQDSRPAPSLGSPRPLLQCYIHPRPLRFPSQPHRPGQLKQYYLLNAASLLPVLALQVRDGDKVLDLCSAPGGKALAIMQSAAPALLCCNEPDPHRRDWLAKTLESYLPRSLNSRVMVSAQDGRFFGQNEAASYDKVLVDAPCSNDRSWLYCGNDHQGEQRLKERAKLPALQAQLLRSALSAVRPGGVVVYSTCTLSSLENHAVVEAALRDFPEAEPEDLRDDVAAPLSEHFAFSFHPGHGLTPRPRESAVSSYRNGLGVLVVPQPGRTWGPMFLSRIRRRKS